MKDAGFCPANTCHTKLHLYHTVVVVGPLNTGSMAAPKPPIVGQSMRIPSVDNNQSIQEHPVPLGISPLAEWITNQEIPRGG